MEGRFPHGERGDGQENKYATYHFAKTLAMCATGEIPEDRHESCLRPYSGDRMGEAEARHGKEIAEMMVQNETAAIKAKLGELAAYCLGAAEFAETVAIDEGALTDHTEVA